MDIDHMSVRHDIDLANQLIVTTWSGKASDNDFIDALTSYQQEIKGHLDYQLFNELLDFRHITDLNLSTRGIIELSRIAQRSDQHEIQTRLAIVVSSTLAFGLAQMYITYRNLVPNNNKKLRVFKSYDDAFDWLTTTVNSDQPH
ncbi:STAS/SEC14 domain-containing protein [Mariprofundus sp. NF]|nr:STAS/SEC14 domain-containing protein [Mariprofundus sp. NF]